MSKGYNGHKNRAYWNVSLWINNDEGLYRFARDLRRELGSNLKAARAFIESMSEQGVTKTPDGERYTVGAVASAMRDILS